MLEESAYKMENYFQNLEESNNESFVLSNKIDPLFEYKGYHKFGRILGRGRFGTVIECLRKSDNQPIALKFFKCSGIHKWIPENLIINSDEASFKKNEIFDSKSINLSNASFASSNNETRTVPSEVACLIRAAKIPGVIKILDYLPANEDIQLDVNENFEESIIGIVLERNTNEICLFDYLLKKQKLEENEARHIIKQLIQINLDLLQNGILHGDLKSENILIDPLSKTIKLIDFGSAQFIDSSIYNGAKNTNVNKLIRTFRGTNLYKPPEYIKNHCFYPRTSTVWTIGIILYDMVCGQFPFLTDLDVLAHQSEKIRFPQQKLSEDFKSLVNRCLSFYVSDRIIIDKILNDPWMTAGK